MTSRPPQSIKSSNPFDDDEDDDDFQDEVQSQTNKVEIQAIKPYEDYFEKFNQFYNQYIERTKQFEQKNQIPIGECAFDVLNISFYPTSNKQALFDLNNTPCKLYDKISSTFAFLDTEISRICETFENKIYSQLCIYGERPIQENMEEDDEANQLPGGQVEYEISRVFGTFKQTLDLSKRIYSLLYNLINQLNIIYYKKQDLHKTIFKNVNLFSVLRTIGKGLSAIYTLDCCVNQNQKLQEHWNFYKRMVKIVSTEPQKYGTDIRNCKKFEKIIARLDKTILSGNCVQELLKLNYDQNSNKPESVLKQENSTLLVNNKDLIELFELYIKQEIQYYSDIIESPTEIHERKEFYYFINTYAFFRYLFPKREDKKTFRLIWTLQKKCPVIEAHSHIYCYIYRFMSEVCPLSKKHSLDPAEPENFLKRYVAEQDEIIVNKINYFYTEFSIWVSRMESILTSNITLACNNQDRQRRITVIDEYISYRIKLLIKALLLCSQLKNLIASNLILHINEEISMDPDIFKHILLGIIIKKAILQIFEQKKDAFQPYIMIKYLLKSITQQMVQILEKLQKTDQKNKKPIYGEFIAAFINILSNLKSGPITPTKISTIDFSLNFILSNYIVDKTEAANLKHTFWKIKTLSQIEYLLQKTTNCSYLFQCRDVIPLFFKEFYTNPSLIPKFPYFSSSLDDTIPLLTSALHLETQQQLYQSFKQSVIQQFNKEYIAPTTRQIEDFLRINIHVMLIDQVKGKDPFKEEIKNINKLLNVKNIQIFGCIFDLQKEIMENLNEKFYNMNAINMHDQETYEEFRILGNQIFDLNLMNVYIPSQTIEQGQLDILNILRNIPQFIDTYTYNLHNQSFTEITTLDSKQITTVGITQISDSIRTHGLGILNTTVNCFYVYLKSKIKLFSQYLRQEQIYQALIREDKWFQEFKSQHDNKYIYERAERLQKAIKKLGTFDDGKNYLDQFRYLLTQIGNALALVRLVKSASLNYCSKCIEFLPSQICDEETFAQMALGALSGETTYNAAEELDKIIGSLRNNFSAKTDYLKKIVLQFSILTQNEAYQHFKYLFYLVPTLSLNYIQHVLLGKDKISQRQSSQAFISDDGFIVGLEFMLKLFQLEELFKGLHWQDVLNEKFDEQLKTIQQLSAQTKDKAISTRKLEEMNMQNELSLRNLISQKGEFQLFFNALQACKILFKDDIL